MMISGPRVESLNDRQTVATKQKCNGSGVVHTQTTTTAMEE